ncbi:MAG: efflux transporter outer membrane subunit [Chlamydiales bacterium]|nr:efflux transporter outer membrane subunit [Chlamydiales bacterium]
MRGWLFGLTLLLTGCLLGPNYHPPDLCVPERWESAGPPPLAWWEEFEDPLLNRYIEQAAACNLDLFIASTHLLKARALRKVAASELFPQVEGYPNALRLALSENGPFFASSFFDQFPEEGFSSLLNIYSFLVSVNWELDLFGRIRRGVEAADATIGSAEEKRHGVLTALFADVALNYIDLRSSQQQAALIEEDIALLEDQAALVLHQWEKGLIDRLASEKLEAQLADLRAALPPIHAQICRDIYILSVLTGTLPESLVEELMPIRALPKPPDCIGCGLRSDLLRRRPDVRQVERELAAATANIGVAVASFFPSFSLLGMVGLQSTEANRLFQLDSKTWGIGALSSIPIYRGGNLVGNLRLTEAAAAAAAFTYQKTVLTALEEAESALAFYQEDRESVCHRKAALERYARIDTITADRFEKGLTDLTHVLESGRQLINAKQNLLDSETVLLLDVINLYKALGGGWELFPQ